MKKEKNYSLDIFFHHSEYNLKIVAVRKWKKYKEEFTFFHRAKDHSILLLSYTKAKYNKDGHYQDYKMWTRYSTSRTNTKKSVIEILEKESVPKDIEIKKAVIKKFQSEVKFNPFKDTN